MNRLLPATIAFALLFASSAHAQEAAAPAQAPASEPATASSPRQEAANTVPSIRIEWNCGECAQNEKIIPLILEDYAAEARKAGYTVSADETVPAEIIDFRQRPPGVRVMFGVMSGKDRLKLKVTRNGQVEMVGDTSANIIQGQNALCAEVAKQLFRAMTGQPAKR